MSDFRAVFASALLLASIAGSVAQSQDDPPSLGKTAIDIERKYTSVGNIGLTVTNFGTIGTRNSSWPAQPSCEYPRGSRIEHIYQGGFWVGALVKTFDVNDSRNNQYLVTTGANDRSTTSLRGGEGYEFNAEVEDSINELSSLTDDRPQQSQFSPLAVSHQDFVCNYSDRYTRVPSTGDSILNHSPLGIRVHQESYAWDFPFADFFVLLRYVIHNESLVDTLDSVYVGLWDNAVVRNTNNVRPGTPGYFDYTGQGFDSLRRTAYSFDFSGQPAPPAAGSYIGVKLLGTTPFPSGVASLADLWHHTYYNAWQFRLSSGVDQYLSPTDDFNSNRWVSRYSRMTESMPPEFIAPLRITPKNVTYLLSTGPFTRLNPGDSVEVVYAVACAKKFGSAAANLDLPVQRQTLYANLGWAQQAYNGEDINGNNALDPGEDIARRDSLSPTELGLRYEPDGLVTRYLLPAPPKRPKARVEVGDRSVSLYWDKSSAEESVDPIAGEKDFEGYRIYRSNTAADFTDHESFVLNLAMVGEFDRDDDSVGYNTGFGRILLTAPKRFPGDTVDYWYRFPPAGVELEHLNGFQYLYGVSAFDRGDAPNNVPSLESAKSLHRVVPGTPAVEDQSRHVSVYPNPYYVNAFWDGSRERLRKIYFTNLPSRSRITVFTVAGDVVTVLDHEASSYAGDNIAWFSEFGDRSTQAEFAGGEHAWDLITRYDQAIATGLYLYTVENLATGELQRGKFLIVK
jgi:hypothetical protein